MALRLLLGFNKEIGFRTLKPGVTGATASRHGCLLLQSHVPVSTFGRIGIGLGTGGYRLIGQLGQTSGGRKHTFTRTMKIWWASANNKLTVLALLFAKQCNCIAALKVRRAVQIATLYNNLGYDKHKVKYVIERLGSRFLQARKDRSSCLLLGAILFNWDREQITDEEITKVGAEMSTLNWHTNNGAVHICDHKFEAEWERVLDRKHLVGWRKPVPNHPYLYEYKVFGTYDDIPGRAFFDAQMDLDFRKEWDQLVIKLEVVDINTSSDCEVVQWIMHYPFPMWSREYVYLRKHKIDRENNLMIIKSRSTDHPSCPIQDKYVRVHTYLSQWVIKPHTTFDENGFDYILTYYDDPQSAFPSPAYNYMARTGVPDFVGKMHDAAKQLHERRHGLYLTQQMSSG